MLALDMSANAKKRFIYVTDNVKNWILLFSMYSAVSLCCMPLGSEVMI